VVGFGVKYMKSVHYFDLFKIISTKRCIRDIRPDLTYPAFAQVLIFLIIGFQ